MVRYKYFGWVTKAVGKTVWEIVGNLRNHGVGRLITRTQFNRYEEPSFYKLIKVEARVDRPPVEPVSIAISICINLDYDKSRKKKKLNKIKIYAHFREEIIIGILLFGWKRCFAVFDFHF